MHILLEKSFVVAWRMYLECEFISIFEGQRRYNKDGGR